MIVWISKEATGRPNDQRATFMSENHEKREITVKMLGDDATLTVPIKSICKIELSDSFIVSVIVKGWEHHSWRSQ